MKEKRKYNRRAVVAHIRLEHEVFGVLEAYTNDISDNGVFVVLDVSPPVNVGDNISLSFLDSFRPDAVFNSSLVRITDKGWALTFVNYEIAGVRRKIDDLRTEYNAKHAASK